MKWSYKLRSIDELKPQEKNPRKISKEQKKQLVESITKFGCAEPIVITKDGTIVGGHQRYFVLKSKKEKLVDCMVCEDELTEKQVDELTVRLNQNKGEFDFDLLAGGYDALDLIDWGFSMDELELESIPDQKKDPKTFQLAVSFENEDDLRDFEDKITDLYSKYRGASYKVKIK